jgi:hypothetical protein
MSGSKPDNGIKRSDISMPHYNRRPLAARLKAGLVTIRWLSAGQKNKSQTMSNESSTQQSLFL